MEPKHGGAQPPTASQVLVRATLFRGIKVALKMGVGPVGIGTGSLIAYFINYFFFKTHFVQAPESLYL